MDIMFKKYTMEIMFNNQFKKQTMEIMFNNQFKNNNGYYVQKIYN